MEPYGNPQMATDASVADANARIQKMLDDFEGKPRPETDPITAFQETINDEPCGLMSQQTCAAPTARVELKSDLPKVATIAESKEYVLTSNIPREMDECPLVERIEELEFSLTVLENNFLDLLRRIEKHNEKACHKI